MASSHPFGNSVPLSATGPCNHCSWDTEWYKKIQKLNLTSSCFAFFFPLRIKFLKGSASGPRDQLAMSDTFLAVPAGEVLMAPGVGVGVQPAP